MNFKRAILALLCLFLAAPAVAQQQQGGNAKIAPDPYPKATPGNINAMFIRAEELRAAGDCIGASALYYRLARRGAGFERSQFGLAECLLVGDQPPDFTDTRMIEGLLWLRRAAEAGLPDAQLRLAELYLSGPDALRDPAEAAFWWAVFERNGQRRAVGYVEPEAARLNRLAQAFDGGLLDEAGKHADFWQPSAWIPHDEIVPPPAADGKKGKN